MTVPSWRVCAVPDLEAQELAQAHRRLPGSRATMRSRAQSSSARTDSCAGWALTVTAVPMSATRAKAKRPGPGRPDLGAGAGGRPAWRGPDDAADPRTERRRPSQDRAHPEGAGAVVGGGELQVVDLADQFAVGIHDLPVQQVQVPVVHRPPGLVVRHGAPLHCPALVAIISGIAASGRRQDRARNAMPSAFGTGR